MDKFIIELENIVKEHGDKEVNITNNQNKQISIKFNLLNIGNEIKVNDKIIGFHVTNKESKRKVLTRI